jgi:hypothetical protein
VEGIVDEMRTGLSRVDGRLEALRAEVHEQLNQMRQEIRSNLIWTIGFLLPMWVTIIAAILLRG